MFTLYELTTDYLNLLQLAEDPDTDPKVLSDTMEGIEGAIEEKADAYAVILKQIEGNIDMMEAEITRLKNKVVVLLNHKSRLLSHLEGAMRATGKTKFKTDKFSFAIQKNGGKLPVELKVPDADYLPDEYVRMTRDVNMTAIREALERGDEKVKEFATYKERGESLRIR